MESLAEGYIREVMNISRHWREIVMAVYYTIIYSNSTIKIDGRYKFTMSKQLNEGYRIHSKHTKSLSKSKS